MYFFSFNNSSLIMIICDITKIIFKCTPKANKKSHKHKSSCNGGVHAQNDKIAIYILFYFLIHNRIFR